VFVQADVTIPTALPRSRREATRGWWVGKVYDFRIGWAGVVSAGLTSSHGLARAHALHTANSAVDQADLDAAVVVSSRQNVLDDALDLAAGALIGLEDDADTGTGYDLAYIRHWHDAMLVWGLGDGTVALRENVCRKTLNELMHRVPM
jgi:hypothetical protein